MPAYQDADIDAEKQRKQLRTRARARTQPRARKHARTHARTPSCAPSRTHVHVCGGKCAHAAKEEAGRGDAQDEYACRACACARKRACTHTCHRDPSDGHTRQTRHADDRRPASSLSKPQQRAPTAAHVRARAGLAVARMCGWLMVGASTYRSQRSVSRCTCWTVLRLARPERRRCPAKAITI